MNGGFVVSSLNPKFKTKELEYIINYSEASTLFVGHEPAEMAASLKPDLPIVNNYIALESPAPGIIAFDDPLASQ